MEAEPCIKECVDAEREIFVGGIAQNVLYDKVKGGDLKATMYLLDRLGSKYGYTPKSISHIGGDKDAPPIKTETASAITLEDLSLECRKEMLAVLRRKEAEEANKSSESVQ